MIQRNTWIAWLVVVPVAWFLPDSWWPGVGAFSFGVAVRLIVDKVHPPREHVVAYRRNL